MRILFVHAIGKCKFGGGEKWVIASAAGLKEKGHDVVVGGRKGSCLLEKAREHGLQTAHFNILSDMSPYQVFRIARFMRRHRTDVAITRGTDLAITGTAARMAGNPVVIVRHGLPMMNRIRKHLFLMRKLADGIITNTQSIKMLYEANNWVPPGFTRVVYNGTEVCRDLRYNGDHDESGRNRGGESSQNRGAESGRNRGGESSQNRGAESGRNDAIGGNGLAERFHGKKVVLAVGRLARQKGYRYLIDAIALVKKKRNDVVLLILGSGKLRRSLSALARKRGVEDMVHFEGFVQNVSPYLTGCDLFVLPSLYEGMSNAAMEAMAHGKPVILTNVNGASELIPDPGKGVLIPPRCPKSIADSVIHLLDNPRLCHKIGREARAHVAKCFPVEGMVKEMEAYLREMVEKKNRGSG